MFTIIQAAGWPIWPLIACSVLGVALVIERFVSLRDNKVAPAKLTDEAITVSRTSVPSPAIVLQLEQNSILGRVLARGLRALTLNPRLSEDDLRASSKVRAVKRLTNSNAICRRWPPSRRRRPYSDCSAR